MKVRTAQITALCLCFLFLLSGFVRTLLHPDSEIYYENRPANRIGTFSTASMLDGSYQDSVEAALADQAPLAVKMKKLYNIFDVGVALPFARSLASHGRYVGFRKYYFFRDMLVLRPNSRTELLDSSCELINTWAAASPETEFYLYYIETDRDLNLETGKKSGNYECFTSALSLSDSHISRLEINSYEDYRRDFLATDHHWNANGAYRAYLDICSMLGIAPLETDGIYTDHGRYLGTRAAGIEGLAPEDFSVVLYHYAPLTISSLGIHAQDYGQLERFVSGQLPAFSYGSVYGGDGGEILFQCPSGTGNALILGDSYDNAILKALAAGFAETWSVDLRAYDADSGLHFDLTSYIEQHDIDLVLFIGGIDFYSSTLLIS